MIGGEAIAIVGYDCRHDAAFGRLNREWREQYAHETSTPAGATSGIGPRLHPACRTLFAILTDKEAEEIRKGLRDGMRGPILIGWCEKLLADRDERRAQERATRRTWPGPLAGPPTGH